MTFVFSIASMFSTKQIEFISRENPDLDKEKPENAEQANAVRDLMWGALYVCNP